MPTEGPAKPYGKDIQLTRRTPKQLARRRFDFDDARARYLAGETTVDLAKDYGVSSTAVRSALMRMGVRLIPHWERPEPNIPEAFQKIIDGHRDATHCKHGHLFDEENTYLNPKGSRECRICSRANGRDWKRRNRAKITAGRKPRVRSDSQRIWLACAGCGERRFMFPLPEGTQRWCRSCRVIQKQGSGEFKSCFHCGKAFYARRRRSGKTAVFCSRDCWLASDYQKTVVGRQLSLARGGDGNPAYRHGRHVGAQIPGWKLNDKGGPRRCRNCGSGVRIELHHAIPRSKARHVRGDLRNGIPLCLSCHRGWHSKTVTLYRDLFAPEEWRFISSVQLTGESIDAWLDRHYPVRPYGKTEQAT